MEFTFLIGLLEEGQYFAPEYVAEYPHRQEEARSTCDPTGVVEGKPPGGDEAMQVRMVAQVLLAR
jgi:hypothetical protein